jgi:hypothetical protein
MLNQVHLTLEGFKLTTLVAIGIDCINSCTFNYHAITTTTHTHPALGQAEKMYKKSINCHKISDSLEHSICSYDSLIYLCNQSLITTKVLKLIPTPNTT